MQPISLGTDLVAASPADLVRVILQSTDKQVAEKAIADEAGREDFIISSDALNYWRVAWRCSVEWGTPILDPAIAVEVKAGISGLRGYDPDDFASVLQATSTRARVPFGWTSLELAWQRTKRGPIRLLVPDLADRKLPTSIAGIAYYLQLHQGEETILLPIDQLRSLLEQRKIVVSGAVQRLVEAGIVAYTNKDYHTGKAREFRFVGVEGDHFEKVALE